MSGDFPSVNDLTWQGQRSSTFAVESTDSLTKGAAGDPLIAESDRGTLSNRSVVYFIASPEGLVKIGFAKDFQDRLRRLICGCPVPLTPLAIFSGGRAEEREYHTRFAAWRRHGEWFELTDELEDEIDRINQHQNPRYRPHRFRGDALPLCLTRVFAPRSVKTSTDLLIGAEGK
jgi:hypothetical protein